MRIANDNFVPFLMNFVQICMRVKDLKREGGGGGNDEYRSIVFGKNWQRRDLRGSRKDYSVDGDERSCENVLND